MVKCKEAEMLDDPREAGSVADEDDNAVVREASVPEDEACTGILGVAVERILDRGVLNEDPDEALEWERVGTGPMTVLVIVK
jgi:hypothetical protein